MLSVATQTGPKLSTQLLCSGFKYEEAGVVYRENRYVKTLLSSKIGFASVLLDSSSMVPVILCLYFNGVRHSSIQSQWEMNSFS